MIKALLVGINSYPQSELNGCINDVRDVSEYLVTRREYRTDSIQLLLDKQATKNGLLDALRDMIGGSEPGDHLLFHFSGHGAQMESKDSGEADGLDEVLCPIDFDWDEPDSAIRDDELKDVLDRTPKGVRVTMVIDACHSGDMKRLMNKDVKPRRLLPPEGLKKRFAGKRGKPRSVRNLGPVSLFISACESHETAADTEFGGRWNGAFTHHWLDQLESTPGASVRELRDEILPDLEEYRMRPTVDGPRSLWSSPYLHKGTENATPPAPAAKPTLWKPSPYDNWESVRAELLRRHPGKDDSVAAVVRRLPADSRAARNHPGYSGNAYFETHGREEALVRGSRGGTVARAFWWGFHIEISHEDLQIFLGAADPINAIIATVGTQTGPAAPFVALAAAFVAGALGLLRGLDRGMGVYISMAWLVPGIFIPTTVVPIRSISNGNGNGNPKGSRDGTENLVNFGSQAITEEAANLIADFDFLRHPAEGFVTWYNDTDQRIHVQTFDQLDAVRWVRYEERYIAPKQVVRITARGNPIHVLVASNGCTFDCNKEQAYLFNGVNVLEKT
ncbi:MAG TPA: caspase family protein [Fibrobacteria bacterium]|nr:caspase family protein [Fibrobacteria bacterium]